EKVIRGSHRTGGGHPRRWGTITAGGCYGWCRNRCLRLLRCVVSRGRPIFRASKRTQRVDEQERQRITRQKTSAQSTRFPEIRLPRGLSRSLCKEQSIPMNPGGYGEVMEKGSARTCPCCQRSTDSLK